MNGTLSRCCSAKIDIANGTEAKTGTCAACGTVIFRCDVRTGRVSRYDGDSDQETPVPLAAAG